MNETDKEEYQMKVNGMKDRLRRVAMVVAPLLVLGLFGMVIRAVSGPGKADGDGDLTPGQAVEAFNAHGRKAGHGIPPSWLQQRESLTAPS